MTVYQVVLKGYDGSTDKTDHLIKWVACSDSLGRPFKSELIDIFGSSIDKIEKTELLVDDAGIDVIITKSSVFKFDSETA